MHPGPQAPESLGDIVRGKTHRRSIKALGGVPGTPPVLRHAIDDDTVEIKDEEGTLLHVRKLGR